MAAADDLAEFLDQELQLATVRQRGVEPRQQVRIAADLPEAGEQREEAEGFFAQRHRDVLAEPRQALRADAGILSALHLRERAEQVHLHLGRELLGHLVFGAAQDERRHLLAQPFHRALAVLDEGRLEGRTRAEQAGQQVAEDGPQVQLAVLQRRAREHEAVLRLDGEARLRHLRVGVLDELALVEDGVAEHDGIEQRAVLAQLRVARQPDAGRLVRGEIIARLQRVDLRAGIKPRQFLAPHRHDAGGADHDVPLAGQRSRAQQGDDLRGLAQAHLVGEQAVAAGLAEVVHPLDAAPLVLAQILRQHRRGRGRGQHLLPPRADLGAQRHLDAMVVEQRKNQIGRDLAVGLGVREVAPPLVVAFPFLRRQRHDAEVGQQHRRAPVPEQGGRLLLRQQLLARAENPAEVQAGAFARPLLGHGLDLDDPGALLEVAHLDVELDAELLFPVWQQVAQETGDVGQRVQGVAVRGLVVAEVGLAGVGRQRDELGPLGRRRRVGRVAQRGNAATAAFPVGQEHEAVGRRGETQHQVAGGRVGLGPVRPVRLAVPVGGRNHRRHRPGQERRHLVHQQFLDLVQPRHGNRVGQHQVGGGGPHLDPVAVPLDHGVFLAFLDLPVDNGIRGSEFDLPDFTIPVHLVPALHVGGVELSLPFGLQPAEPEFERLWSVDALRPVGLHQAKSQTLETSARSAQSLFRFSAHPVPGHFTQSSPGRHRFLTEPGHAGAVLHGWKVTAARAKPIESCPSHRNLRP